MPFRVDPTSSLPTTRWVRARRAGLECAVDAPRRASRRSGFGLGQLAGLALLVSAQVARAGEPEDSKLAGLTIVYQAPDQCPGREVFQAALAARLNAPADTRRGRTLVDASFSLRARRITARVSLRDPAGGVRERSIEAETCREAIDALALITALALSPSAIARQRGRSCRDGSRGSTYRRSR
jgi:hypothetical protein